MLLAVVAVLAGLALLIWSAAWFVEGASATAHHVGVSPLVIGMVIVGFGTSMPEMIVSVMSAVKGSPSIALGNAYGSNIANIALILGLAAMICPINVHSKVLRKELPILAAITALAIWLLLDQFLQRGEALMLLGLFVALMSWSIWQGKRADTDDFGAEIAVELEHHRLRLSRAIFEMLVGVIVLTLSSRALVWGAVILAQRFGVSDLIIGLTIIAIGTSLPELASTTVAAYRREHDIALGNVIGSNLFNTMAVVGLAGTIHPLQVEPAFLRRDVLVTAILTASLFVLGYRRGGGGSINRVEGALLLCTYIAYLGLLVYSALT